MNWLKQTAGKVIAILSVVALVLVCVLFVSWFDSRDVVMNSDTPVQRTPASNPVTEVTPVEKLSVEESDTARETNPVQNGTVQNESVQSDTSQQEIPQNETVENESTSVDQPADEAAVARLIVCLGDSITYGIGADTGIDTNSWPAVLNELLGPQYEVLNYGVPGAYITDGTVTPYREYPYIDRALEQYPSMIIILFGSNDCRADSWDPEGFKDSYAAVIEQIRATSPGTAVVLLSPPMAYEEEIYEGDPSEVARNAVIRDEINPILRELVATYGLKYIDLYSFTEPHRDWYVDGLHLNTYGYHEVAAYIYEQLGL
ncbi:MAG: hypothetical protein IKE43_12180 [Coriobacteriales bacterium]|nr:hypothetical protein [Coriobacteriales bacterium]